MRPAGPLDYLCVDAALTRYRAGLDAPAARTFDGWTASFWANLGQDPPGAYVDGEEVALLDGSADHRIVVQSAPGVLPALVATLQADPRIKAISLPKSAAPGPGFKPVERWEHRFDLRFGPVDPGAPPRGYTVTPWDDSRRPEAAALLNATNGATVDGVFLTWPDAPTPERCQALLDDLIGGSHGAFCRDTSLMALHAGRLVALLLVTLPSDEEALLYEIAVRFRHRGTGLAPFLLDRLKSTLRPRGFRHIRFLACGANAAVSSLFRADEVRSELLDAGWIWLRD